MNQELLGLGLLSQEVSTGSSLVKADVSSYRLSSSGLPVANFQERAVEGNRLFVLGEAGLEEYGTEEGEVRLFQDPKGALPLTPVGAVARWRTTKPEKSGYLSYRENIAVDPGGFIMARTIAYSSDGEWKALPPMLEEVPIEPVSLAADNGSSASQLRQSLEELGITAYIPLHPNQSSSKAARGEFVYRGDHLLCSQGKILRPGTSRSRSQSYRHPALQKDRQACPVKAECLPPRVSSRPECPPAGSVLYPKKNGVT